MRRPKRHQSKRELRERYERCKSKNSILIDLKSECERDIIALEKRIRDLNHKLEQVQKREETCQQIINRAISIDFRRCEAGFYAIELRFNGDFMGGISRFGEQLEYVAERVARDIQRQIASSKFIETAWQNERRRMESDMRLRSAMGPPGWGEGRNDGH